MSTLEGQHWHIQRGFIDPNQAQLAAGQAEALKQREPDYAEEFLPKERSWDESLLTVLQVSLSRMPASDAKAFADLVEAAGIVNRTAGEMTGDSSNGNEEAFFLNFYAPGASTGEQRDSHTAATVAVGLRGIATAYIQDLDDGAWRRPLTLYPTDALCFDNDIPETERPLHVVECSRDISRVAIVNAAA